MNNTKSGDSSKKMDCPYCGVIFESSDELFTHVFTFHSC